jgi:hypothetical protein
MFIALLNIPTVLNVAAGATAVVQPDPTGTYFGIRLFYTRAGVAATAAQIASDISMIRVNLNGTTQWQLTGAELQMINAFRGLNVQNGEIPLWFHEPYRKAESQQDLRSWGMVGIDTFTIEVDIASGAVTPGLTALRYWLPTPTVMGEIRKFKRQTIPITATGDTTVNTLPRNDRQLNFHCNSSVITNWKVKINNIEYYNHAPVRLHDLMQEYGMVPQTGWSHLAFDFRNRGSLFTEGAEPFVLTNSNGRGVFPPTTLLPWEQTFTMSAATSFNLVRELSGPRD